MERKMPAFMLERTLFQSASMDDLSYFLGTSDAQVPQVLSVDFAGRFKEMIDLAINNNNLKSVSILTQVLSHVVQQDLTQSIQHLISSNLHSNFEPMVVFLLKVICDKSSHNSGAIKSFLSLIAAIIDYSKKMNDHCIWLIQNMLHVILLVLGETNVALLVKAQTCEKFLNIFEDEDGQVSPSCRAFVQKNEQLFDELSKRVLGSLHRSGHLQLQELIVEMIIRMWMTEIRKRKAMKWFDNNQAIASTFLAISYDEFDYGLRIFLNQLNGSTEKRRILTLSYKELQIGKQSFFPSNKWCNCIDLCYGSKVLDVRYPYEEAGLQHEHKCSWKLGTIRSADLVSFCASDNIAARTVDLHLRFQEPTCHVLTDFSLENQTASDLIIRLDKTMNVDAKRVTHFVSSLFGCKYLVKPSAMYSVPKHGLFSSGPWTMFGSQSDREAVNASFIQLSQESQLKSSQAPDTARNALPTTAVRNIPQPVSIPSQRTNHAAKASQSQRQSESQVKMMKSLALQASCKRNNAEPVKPVCHVAAAAWCSSPEVPVLLKGLREKQPSQTSKADLRQSQRVSVPTVQYTKADIHRHLTSSDSSNDPDQSGPQSKARLNSETINNIASYNRLTSLPISFGQNVTRESQIKMKPRLIEDAKRIVHNTDSDCIHGDSSEEFFDKKRKQKPQRKEAKVGNVVPETQATLSTSIAKKSEHNVSAADTSVDLMLQCLHGSGASDQPPEILNDMEDETLKNQNADSTHTKRITRSQKLKQAPGKNNSEKMASTCQRSRKKDVSSGTESAASKVNDEFKQLEEMVPVEQADDPATKSVTKRPYAGKFIKNTTTNEKKEKTARGKRKPSTRKALRSLNIDPRQNVNNQTAEVHKPVPVKKRRKKQQLPLPYEELEEVDEITDTQHDENILSPVEAVRDATFDRDVLGVLGSPIWITSPQKKPLVNILLSEEISSEGRPKEVKKKSKVSFSPGAKTGSQNNKKSSAKYLNPKKKRQARLFDSVSEATSGTASDPSWVLEHASRMNESPKLEKNYKGARLRKRRERKRATKKRSLEQVIDSTFHRSVSEEESNVSPLTNNSVLSGVSLLQSLGSACNLDFDQIAAESDCLPPEPDLETASTRLCDISDIQLEWNNPVLTPAADGDSVLHGGDHFEPDKRDENNSGRESSADLADDDEAKEFEEYHDLNAAKVNNNTPTDSHERFNFTGKTFHDKKKAMAQIKSPPTENKFMKSKKKLEMRPCSIAEESSSSDHDVSACDSGKAKSLMKLMKNYVRVIDEKWAEGHTQRASCIESYQSKIKKQVTHYESQMKGLESLQDEALKFVGYFNTSFNAIMKDAAKGLLESKLACKDLTARLAHHTKSQDDSMNELRRQISRDLKKQVAQVDREDARGK